jgi:riboflavin synthase
MRITVIWLSKRHNSPLRLLTHHGTLRRMFSGIIYHQGTLTKSIPSSGGGMRGFIQCSPVLLNAPLGSSIACAGVCLTMTDKETDGFWVDISPATLSSTLWDEYAIGQRINLEPSLKLGDSLDGHLVYGHVDGCVSLDAIEIQGNSHVLRFSLPRDLAPYIATKGSVALDGVSLTVQGVDAAYFTVMIIPHTWQETTLKYLKKQDKVHLEVDMLARYAMRARNYLYVC